MRREGVRERDAVLDAACLGEVVVERIPDRVREALLRLDDGLVEREPVLDLLAELVERSAGVVRVRLDDLAVLPPAAVVEVGGHVKVVQVHEDVDAGLCECGEELVVVVCASLVELAVLVHEAAPLDGRPHGVEAEVLEDLDVLVATTREIVSAIGPDQVIEVRDVEIAPTVPQVGQLSRRLPRALRLGSGHGGSKEEVLGKLRGKFDLAHRPSLSFLQSLASFYMSFYLSLYVLLCYYTDSFCVQYRFSTLPLNGIVIALNGFIHVF